ncbi:hypothetical protein MMC08_008010, partial [Hypocenomyce scalaris]|nr:hypothetical protein [Hypocenomyce scalaris]
MALPKKLQDIYEGVYLSDFKSNSSLKSSPYHHEAVDRPFAIPCYDPEGSTITSKQTAPPPYAKKVLPPLPARPVSKDSTSRSQWYPPPSDDWNDIIQKQVGYGQNLVADRSRNKRSRLSITPSAFHVGAGCRPLSVSQATELARLNRHGRDAPAIPSPKADEGTLPEPPDGGTMAWLHVVAGHLVVFNAQGLNMSYGLFQAYYESSLLLSHSPSQIAWIGSFQIFLLFATGIVVSPLVDR